MTVEQSNATTKTFASGVNKMYLGGPVERRVFFPTTSKRSNSAMGPTCGFLKSNNEMTVVEVVIAMTGEQGSNAIVGFALPVNTIDGVSESSVKQRTWPSSQDTPIRCLVL
eukprot:CAMPEP_0113847016 /NCGR_PEP_ID=MMETSP0372-20130328/1629_1 /TAXON_ID=340204 /ORGANISM="Lankesteria abbotti" /LENGTH=110 /DNA_ID=CAMNT_0000816225 /DNA_START=385 /DNA_END=717 /DNA_ORIENTATION=- /assembly_acc=CAM_ASM_000359